MSTIYKEIIHDHDVARKLIKEIMKLNSNAKEERASLFNQLKEELLAHAEAEEKSLYSEMSTRSSKELKDKAEHGKEEHNEIEELLKELTNYKESGEKWVEKFKELKESLEHHMDEEEKEIFNATKEVFDKSTEEALGEKMKDQKDVELNDLDIRTRQKA